MGKPFDSINKTAAKPQFHILIRLESNASTKQKETKMGKEVAEEGRVARRENLTHVSP
jgi:hypothetical protein